MIWEATPPAIPYLLTSDFGNQGTGSEREGSEKKRKNVLFASLTEKVRIERGIFTPL